MIFKIKLLFTGVLLHLILGVLGEDHDYIVVPMNLAHLGSSHKQFLHIYVTGSRDTDVDITIPTTSFSQCFSLSAANQWSWKNEYILDGTILTESIQNGFHIKGNEELNIYVTRNSSAANSLTSFMALPMKEGSKSHLLSPYMRNHPSVGFSPVYVVAAGAKGTTVDVWKYNINTGLPSKILHRTLQPFEVLYQIITTTTNDYGIGLEVNATDPVAVFAGNERTYIPTERATWIQNYIQIPDLSALQEEFIIGPFPGDFESNGYSVLIVFAHEDTVAKLKFNIGTTITVRRQSHSCSCVTTSGGCTFHCSKTITRGAYVEFATNKASVPIMVTCSKPCQTLAVKHSQTTNLQRPQGYMSLVASPKLRSSDLRVFVPNIGESLAVQQSYLIIAVPSNKLEYVLVDGDSIINRRYGTSSSTLGNWTVVTATVFPGVHVIQFRGGDIPAAVHVHGTSLRLVCSPCYSSSSGFPAIFQVADELLMATTAPTDGDIITTDDGHIPLTTSPMIEHKVNSQISNIDIAMLSLLLATLVGIVSLLGVVIFIYRRSGSNPTSNEPKLRYDAGTSNLSYQTNGADDDRQNKQTYVDMDRSRYLNVHRRKYDETQSTDQETYEEVQEKYEPLQHQRN